MNRVLIISGKRTPFLKALTQFQDFKPNDLLKHAIIQTVNSVDNIDKSDVNYVIAGQTLQSESSNIARDSIISAGFDVNSCCAHSVTMACISSNQAISSIFNLIANHEIECGIGCGVDSLSDPPIRVTRSLRKWILLMNKKKNWNQKTVHFLKMRPSMIFGFESPQIAEFSTNETMGESCDRLTKAFGVSREDQDKFGVRSHELAKKAEKEGKLSDVSPIIVSKFGLIEKDNGIRVTNLETVSKLKPSFNKDGTANASNSSYLTDGASATLLMSESKAKKLGIKAKILIKDLNFVAIDPKEHLLLGPSHATTRLLRKNKLSVADISVFEYHEAFSGQLLANLVAMESDKYSREKIGCAPLGSIALERVNSWGGSVSLGHPFGATGSRLVNMAVNRLLESRGKYALISACAGGGLGHAMLIENVS